MEPPHPYLDCGRLFSMKLVQESWYKKGFGKTSSDRYRHTATEIYSMLTRDISFFTLKKEKKKFIGIFLP